MLNAAILKVRQPIESTAMFAANDTVYFYDRENSLLAVNTFNLETASEKCKTGYSQNHYRDYDSSTGRELQPDPRGILLDFSDPDRQVAYKMGIGIPDKANLLGYLNHSYGYADQNPIMYTDPTGEGVGQAAVIIIVIGTWAFNNIYDSFNQTWDKPPQEPPPYTDDGVQCKRNEPQVGPMPPQNSSPVVPPPTALGRAVVPYGMPLRK